MAGLYLHTPFCRQKCSYCDFFSAPPEANQLERWPEFLQTHLRYIGSRERHAIETIFFGGGTPSLLPPTDISTLLETCRFQFNLDPQAEISLEANPADLTPEKLDGYRTAGINRLSIGIQSFSDQQLQRLGRRHGAQMAIKAFQAARSSGFDNISVDLMFALPDQNRTELDDDIEQLLDLAPDHVGIYGLSLEEGTSLHEEIKQGQYSTPDEEFYATAYLHLSSRLQTAGFEHYEISNFARPGHRCRHNMGYWQRSACLAAGCGAHGFDPSDYGSRYAIPEDLPLYFQQLEKGLNPVIELECFTREQAMSETLYLGLRTSDGVDCDAFMLRFGKSPKETYPQALTRLSPYLQETFNRWQLSPEGWLLYDHLISHFLLNGPLA